MLLTLPSEILQNITRFLPSKDALQILQVCHRLNYVCDHWTIWQDILSKELIINTQELRLWTSKEVWKQYVYIDSLLDQIDFSMPLPLRIFRWLPHLVVLKRVLLSLFRY
jgi:hypothetical protein